MAGNKIEKIADGVWRQQIPGTDLEVNFNLAGSDLVVRVNKGMAQICRVVLKGAAREMTDEQVAAFSPVSPDFSFKVGDLNEGFARIVRSAGLILG